MAPKRKLNPGTPSADHRTDTDRVHARAHHPDVVADALSPAAQKAIENLPPAARKAVARAVTLQAHDSWATDRTGNPGWMIDGWQVTSHRDPLEVMHQFVGHKNNPEWNINRIAPLVPDWLDQRRKQLGIQKIAARSVNPDAELQGQEKRRALVEAVRNGSTITKACQLVGVIPNTYSKWRKRFPEWAIEMDAAKHWRNSRAGIASAPKLERPDFIDFRRYFFGYETYRHHQQIIQAIEDTPPGGFTMILVPPEAGKTTLVEDWLCYQIALDPNHRILLCTEAGTQGQAQKMLGTVKERLTDADASNPDSQYDLHIREFLARYGPFRDDQEDKDKPWNANYIKVHRASGRRDYTLQCCGWRSKVYGSRCDTLVFDDVQSSDSINLTENILHRMRGTFFSRVNQNGKMVYIGTRNAVGDVPEKLIESGAIDRLVIIEAIDGDGNSYCPEMWPEEKLAQKRRLVGEPAWWCNYMQNPRQAENATFDLELLEEARDPDIKVGEVPDGHRVVLGLDPALGGHTALTCTAWTPQHLQVVDVWDQPDLARNEEIFSMVADYARRYRPSELVVEINSMQRGIARDDRLRDMARHYGFTISEHETNVTKWEHEFGVAAMAGSFIRREIIFPDRTEYCRSKLGPLVDQLERWRPNVPARLLRQDMVMALWFPWRRWMEYREASRVDVDMWSAAGTPWYQEGAGVIGAIPWAGASN